VSEDRQRPARYRLTFGLHIPADLVAVQQTAQTRWMRHKPSSTTLAHGRV